MPTFYAADTEVRLMVCDLAASVTLSPTVSVGSDAQDKHRASISAFSQGKVLREQHLSCLASQSSLHFLGQHANIPFYLAAANPLSHRVSSFIPPPKPCPRVSPPPASTGEKALYAALRFGRKIATAQHPSVKVEAFLNGDLASHVILNPKRGGDLALAPPLILSGKRIARLQEKPWILKTSKGPESHGNRASATQHWAAVAEALRAEADSRGCDQRGFRQPTGDYLASLSSLMIPDSVANLDMSASQSYAVLDIMISVGHGKKYGPEDGYLTTPKPFRDPTFSSDAANALSDTCVDDGGAAVLANLQLNGSIPREPSPNVPPVLPATPENAVRDSTPLTPMKEAPKISDERLTGDGSVTTKFKLPRTPAPNPNAGNGSRSVSRLVLTRGSGAKRTPILIHDFSSPLQLKTSPETPLKAKSTGTHALHLPSNGSPAPRLNNTRPNSRRNNNKRDSSARAARAKDDDAPDSDLCSVITNLVVLACADLQKSPEWPYGRKDSTKPRVTSPLKNCTNSDTVDAAASEDEYTPKAKRRKTGPPPATARRVTRTNGDADTASGRPGPGLVLHPSVQGMSFDFVMPELSRRSAVTYDERDAAAVRQIGRERMGEFSEKMVVMGVRYIVPPGAGCDDG